MSSGQELPSIVTAPPGPRSRELAARIAAVECPAFEERRVARAARSGEDQGAVVYARGTGSNVFDVDDNRFVDLTAGFGALVLGYGPNAATEAAARAMGELTLALGDVYASELKVRATEALAGLFPEPGARVLFGLSGADAVTAALKTAALATKRPRIVSFEGSYHGLSHGPLAALGLTAAFREPFAAQLGTAVTFAPYPGGATSLDASLSAVQAALAGGDVAAVLVEPLLGRGGCLVPPSAFLVELRALCTRAGALLLLDEVWTGMGRSGALVACADAGVVPDVLCLGKGLGGGVPVSACIGRADVMAAWGGHGGTMIHTGTHFGSPAASAALLATLEVLRREDLPGRARRVGDAFRTELAQAIGSERVRGRGLMIGVQLDSSAHALAVARRMLARGYVVLTGGTKGDALTLSPALTIAPELLSAAARALAETLVL